MDKKRAWLFGAAAVALTLWVSRQIYAQQEDETTGAEETEALTEPEAFETNEDGLRIFTLEELAFYDGTDGRPVYVAYNGFVYDISNVPQWRDGEHHGHRAGIDFTELLEESPHGPGILQFMPIVGVLAE